MGTPFHFLANLSFNHTVGTDRCGLFLEFNKRTLFGCLVIKKENATGRLNDAN